MSEQNNAPAPVVDQVLVLPAFGKSPALRLEMGNIREAELRLIEAKTVNPITYVELEHSFNEAYRDLKRHLASIGFAISQAQKALEDAKANIILGSYQEHAKAFPKEANADVRNAFLTRDPAYTAAAERIDQLKAIEANMDGKIKVIENVCRYMRQQMRLIERSGMSNASLYVTSGKQK